MAAALENDLSALKPAVRAALARAPAHFVGGRWLPAKDTIAVLDPSSGEQIARIARGSPADVDAAVRSAQGALTSPQWGQAGPMAREQWLRRLAELIDAEAETIATIETLDNGMPQWLAQGINIAGSAGVYRYFAGWPSKLSGDTLQIGAPPSLGRFLGMTLREPVGVIGAIVPWNVPFMLAAWKLGPALAAGCTVVLKPAEDASLSALLLADLIERAGFPPGVVNVVTGYGAEAGDALVRHAGVAKISFTGSTATGRRIGAVAGEQLKRVTLELGGKSPTLIFEDADLDAATRGAADAIFFNSGQVCVAGSRLYVHERVYDGVLGRLEQHVKTLTVGAGLSNANLGPLISDKQRSRVRGYISQAQARRLTLFGNATIEGRGFYVGPTVITGASADDAITQEEIFGPVLSVYRFSNDEEAVRLANGTAYGLAASVWSQDITRVLNLVGRIQAGKVSVNTGGFPYPALPEGGYKQSGYGRDLGHEAVSQCLQTKSVLIKTG